jgi:hypothetical protein
VQEELRHIARKSMHVVAGLRKVGSRELVLHNEREDPRVDHGAQRLDRILDKRIAALLVAVEVSDR